jgi:hypothetical protein
MKTNYKNFIPMAGYKNKPNQSQNKPNSKPIAERPKMNTNIYYTIDYKNKTAFRRRTNKPKQSQNKPNLRNAQNELKIACQNPNCRYNSIAAGPCVSRRKSGQRE